MHISPQACAKGKDCIFVVQGHNLIDGDEVTLEAGLVDTDLLEDYQVGVMDKMSNASTLHEAFLMPSTSSTAPPTSSGASSALAVVVPYDPSLVASRSLTIR